jgi:hypothetical protein
MWFRSLAHSAKPRKARSTIRRALCRPRLEALEDRCQPSFLSPVNYAVGTNPVAVVTADLANNGKLDLITANASDNTISVRMGNGDGTFGPATPYAVGTYPESVAVGDFNGDGKLDLAVANGNSASVSVLLGNGDGSFQAAKSYAVGNGPVSVAIGNFDGQLDIVTANIADGTVTLLPGNGDGTFGAAQTVANFSSGAASVAVGDFNGDGKLDLAVATRGTNGYWGYYGYYPGISPAVTVLMGNGNGTFTTGSSYDLPTNGQPQSYGLATVATADLNGDTKPDLAITDPSAGEVSVLLNAGGGAFTGPTSFSTAGSSPESLAVADFNGDGRPDLVMANTYSNTLSVLPNIGNGNFGNPYAFTAGSSPASVAAGDLNRDGKTDVAVANSGDNNVSVLLNDGYWPSLQVAATDSHTGVPISSTTAGQSFNLTVTADDPSGNVLTGYTDTVSFSTSDAQGTIIDPATGNPVSLASFKYTFTAADHGTHTFSVDLKTAYEWSPDQFIGVSDSSVGLVPTGPAIAVYPGAVSSFTVSGFPSPTAAGYQGDFTVTAYDAYGNLAYNYTGTAIFSTSDLQATILNPATGNPVPLAGFTYTFGSYNYGTASFSATLNTAGMNQWITATDSLNSKAAGSETGIEVDLAVSINGPSGSYLNESLTYTLGTVGDPAGTIFKYQINWGDGSPVQSVTGPSGTQVSHTYSTAGNRGVTVTATDPNGLSGTGSDYVFTASLTVAIQTDPAHTSQQMLVINDTSSGYNGNSISLSSAANNGVTLYADGYNLGTLAPTNSNPFALVMAFANSGYGDTLNAGQLTISSVLVGGSGYSYLYGGSARNLLIAGTGRGTLSAGSGGDILIGGTTKYDSNTTALAYIMAEWDSSDSYSTRISKISKGVGPNSSYALNSKTVSQNSLSDYLYGGAGMDWFFANTRGKKNKDYIYNQKSGETVTQI